MNIHTVLELFQSQGCSLCLASDLNNINIKEEPSVLTSCQLYVILGHSQIGNSLETSLSIKENGRESELSKGLSLQARGSKHKFYTNRGV